MGPRYFVHEKDLKSWLGSDQTRKKLEAYETKVREVGTTFEALDKDKREPLEARGNELIRLDAEREVKIEEDLADEEAVYREQKEETLEIQEKLEKLLPLVARATASDKSEYALAFLDYLGRKGEKTH